MTSQKFVELYHVTCIFHIFLDSTIEISGPDFPHLPIFRKIKNGRTANFAKIGCLTVESCGIYLFKRRLSAEGAMPDSKKR